jgi:glycosyltransferase involved in cell wall biosynthesis
MNSSTLPISPKITVLLPVFNAEAFLRESVESILGQTFTDFELLAINDGSTDRSRDILTSFSDSRFKIVDNDGNRGLIYTLNRGIELARGELVARMDADDISLKNRFEKQVNFLNNHPKIALLGSWAEFVDQAGRNILLREVPVGNKIIQGKLLEVCCFVHPSVMFRTSVVRGLCGYRQDALHAEDYDLWLRISENHEVDNLPEPLIRYRIHPGQVSQRQLQTQRKVADTCRIASWRRRIDSGILAPETTSPIPGWLAQLRGENNTKGGDYLGWLQLYQIMGRDDIASTLLWPLLRTAPLNRQAHRELLHKLLGPDITTNTLRTLRWYKHRLFQILRGEF